MVKKNLDYTLIIKLSVLLIGIVITIYFSFAKSLEKIILSLLVTLVVETIIHIFDTKKILTYTNSLINSTNNSRFNPKENDWILFMLPFIRKKDEGIPEISTQAKDCNEIWILFNTGKDLVEKYGGFLQEKCIGGCKLRVIMADQESDAFKSWTKWYQEVGSDEGNKKNQEVGPNGEKRNIKNEIDEALKLQKSGINIRTLADIIPFTMFVTDPESKNGKMVIGFQTYKGYSGEKPYLYLSADDKKWYGYFIRQYITMWRNSVDVMDNKHNISKKITSL